MSSCRATNAKVIEAFRVDAWPGDEARVVEDALRMRSRVRRASVFRVERAGGARPRALVYVETRGILARLPIVGARIARGLEAAARAMAVALLGVDEADVSVEVVVG